MRSPLQCKILVIYSTFSGRLFHPKNVPHLDFDAMYTKWSETSATIIYIHNWRGKTSYRGNKCQCSSHNSKGIGKTISRSPFFPAPFRLHPYYSLNLHEITFNNHSVHTLNIFWPTFSSYFGNIVKKSLCHIVCQYLYVHLAKKHPRHHWTNSSCRLRLLLNRKSWSYIQHFLNNQFFFIT